MLDFLNPHLRVVKDPGKFPTWLTECFGNKIKEIRFYDHNPYFISIVFHNGNSGFVKHYGKPVQRPGLRMEIRPVVVDGNVSNGLKLLDAAAERRKYPSQASYEYNKFIQTFNRSQRGENVKKRLAWGSKGEPVVQLQTILNTYSKAFGFQPLKTDGIFGARTSSAVKWFQFFAGCKIDGIVGVETWTAIDKFGA